MTTLIGLPRQTVIAMMTRENIACSVEAFERVLQVAQMHALVMEIGPQRAREAFERVDSVRRESRIDHMEEACKPQN